MFKLLLRKDNLNLEKSQLEILEKVLVWSKDYFEKAERTNQVSLGGHGFDHVVRVAGYTKYICQKEHVNPFLPMLSALIHDIGRASKDPRSHTYLHGQLSREITDKFVHSLGLSDDQLETIQNAIEDHPLLNSEVRQTDVVKILMDADRLDAFGHTGIVRAGANRWKPPVCLFNDKKLNPQDEKIKTAYEDISIRIMEWYEMFWTKTAKKMAKPRYKFLKEFCIEFKDEIDFTEKQIDSIFKKQP